MFAIFKREFKGYFYSPMAYVLIGLYMLMSSFFFLGNLYDGNADFNGNLSTMGFLLLFIIPILTMRILAEDRKSGTEVLLITSPANITSIVVGKYLAALCVFLVMTAITFVYPIIIAIFGDPAYAQLIGGYVGYILLGASFIAVGVLASSLTESQVIAAVIGFVSMLTMWIMDYLASFVGGILAIVLNWLSLFSRYYDFNIGILNLAPVVYYISFISVFLFITIRVIERRRWSQG